MFFLPVLGLIAAAGVGYLAGKLFSKNIDATAEKMSMMGEYDETDFHQVVDISGEFASLQVEVEKEFKNQEDTIIDKLEESFNNKIIDKISVDDINLKKYLKSEAKSISNSIRGTLIFSMKRRYTIDNSELRGILELEAGEEKRISLKRYLEISLEEGKNDLFTKINEEINCFIKIAEEEVENLQNLRLEQSKNNLIELNQIIKLKELENEGLQEKLLPNKFNIIISNTVNEIFK